MIEIAERVRDVCAEVGSTLSVGAKAISTIDREDWLAVAIACIILSGCVVSSIKRIMFA